MKNKRNILRRTAAFITALTFTAYTNYGILGYAAENTDFAEVTEKNESEESVTNDETDNDENSEDTEEKEIYRNHSLTFKINGTTAPDMEAIVSSMFMMVREIFVNGTSVVISVPDVLDFTGYMYDYENYTNGEKVFIITPDAVYYLKQVLEITDNYAEIVLEECYDLNEFSSDIMKYVPAEDNGFNQECYPYGENVKAEACEGWVFDTETVFALKGRLSYDIREGKGNNYSLYIQNGIEGINTSVRKSTYEVEFEHVDGIECSVNGTGSEKVNCTWIDDKEIKADFWVSDDADLLIKEAELINLKTGRTIATSESKDGRSVSLNYKLKEYVHDLELYKLQIKTYSNSIDGKIYCENKKIIDKKYFIEVDGGICNISFDPVIFEDGVAKYIIDSYKLGDSQRQFVSIGDILEDNKICEKIKIKYSYEESIVLRYKKIEYDNKITYNIVPTPTFSKNAYVLSNLPVMKMLEFYKNDKELYFIYSILNYNNDITYNATSEVSKFSYYKNDYFDNKTKSISISSILYLDDEGEVHNILQSPLYFYIDDYAPKIEIEDEHETNEKKWSNFIYEFYINVNDKEEFLPVEGNDELNAIYENINGSSSAIAEIAVGDYIFKKEGRIWEHQKFEGITPEYGLNVQEVEDGRYKVRAFSTIKRAFEGKYDVWVKDSCGNRSEIKTVDIKVDTKVPEVSAMEIESSKFFEVSDETGPVKKAAVNSRNFEIKVKAEDDTSGLDRIEVSFGEEKYVYQVSSPEVAEKLNCTFEDEKYTFIIPVSPDKDLCSKLSVKIYDRAGNAKRFWYSTNAVSGITEEENEASDVVVDTLPPECRAELNKSEKYTKNGNEKWYSALPSCSIFADDKNSPVCSGVEYINVDVNGIYKKISVPVSESCSDYSVIFEHDEKNPEKVTVLLHNSAENAESKDSVLGRTDLRDTDGKVQITVSAEDAAGNISEPETVTMFADTSAPLSAPCYKLSESKGNITSFGTFFRDGVKLSIHVSEKEGLPASGLKNAVLTWNKEQYEYVFENTDEADAEFFIPFNTTGINALSGSLTLTVYDNVGNRYDSDVLLSEEGSSRIIFENKPPVITGPSVDVPVKYTDGENKWYSDDVSMLFSISDAADSDIYSGLKNTLITVNGRNYSGESFSKMQDARDYKIDTAKTEEADGKYTLKVSAEDNAGNKAAEKETVFYIDKTAPKVTGISIDGVNSVPLSVAKGFIALPYGYFFGNEAKINIYAVDENASSGLEKLHVTLYNFDGTVNDQFDLKGESLRFDAESSVYTADFKVDKNFKGIISVYAADNVGHESDTVTPNGFILEKKEYHDADENAFSRIILPETSYADQGGISLYREDVPVVFSAADGFSGIKKIEWTMSEYGENVWKQITVDDSGKISGDSADSFSVTGTDLNLVTEIKGNITASADRNATAVRIRMTDNAGNTKEDYRIFSIDKTAPEITVTYDDSRPDEKYTDIYKNPRTAYVRVKERNFDGSRIKISVEGENSGASVGEWTLAEGVSGTDSAVYQSAVVFSGDGEYKLRVDGTDMCENRAAGYESASFTVDRTAPSVEVSSDNSEKYGDRFYSAGRVFTVKVTEHNFNPERIKITGTVDGNTEEFPELSSWNSSGDEHTAVIRFEKDAEYTLNITGSDKAGNNLSDFSESFCIDQKAPEIIFDGVRNKSANRGDVKLRVLINDINLDKNSVSVKVTGAKRGDISDKAGVLRETEEGMVFELNELPSEKEFDDIYTVSVSSADMADNRSSDEIVFSVNRFGSNYVFDEKALLIAGTYIKKPVDIVLHEINTDKLREGKTVVKIVKDSANITLTEGEDYNVTVSGGNGKWYDYRYEISASNFADDAAYMVIICSEDEAGNLNDSTHEDKKAELRFGVDKTPPRCIPVNIEENGSYRTDALEVSLVVTDNIMVDDIGVYLNGSEVPEELTVDGKNCKFMMSSSDKSQNVRIVTRDKAGNETETLVGNVLVSDNVVKVLWHKMWVKVVFWSAVTGGVAGVIAAIKGKRKRRMM